MLGNAVKHLNGEVEPLALFFQDVHHPQALVVMAEALGVELVQHRFPGVAEGGVPEIMAQGDGLGEMAVEAQGHGNGPGDLAYLEHMGEPGPVMVAGGGQEHLGFMLEAAEGLAVDDPVPVPLVGASDGAFLFGPEPTFGVAAQGGIGREACGLALLDLLTDGMVHWFKGPGPDCPHG